MQKVSVALIHLGCPKNLVDSEVLLGYLEKDFTIVSSLDKADVIVVNTCGFIESAKQEALDAIFQAGEFKKDRCKALIVAGCLAQRYGRTLQEEISEIDGILGVEELPRVNEVVRKALLGQRPLNIARTGYIASSTPRKLSSLHSIYIKIAEGCFNNCTYCAIPLIRGRQRSRLIQDIVKEAKDCVGLGAKELTLVAQDTTCYGLDLEEKATLGELLTALGKELPKETWLRTLYFNPTRFTPELIKAFTEVKQLCPYIDLPLQHISQNVLKRMGRSFDKEKTLQLIKFLRKEIPGIALRTTFLLGFPGETEGDFNELLDFVKEVRFDHVGAFAFSKEEGTKAYSLGPEVPKKLSEERVNRLMEMQMRISKEKNRAKVGQVFDVLCLGPSEESELVLQGRTKFQAPEIDGVTYFGIPDRVCKAGDIVKVKITQSLEYDLAGDVVE